MLMAQKNPVNCHTSRTQSLSYFSFYLFFFHVAVFSLCDGLALYTLVVSSVVFCHVFCFWFVFLMCFLKLGHFYSFFSSCIVSSLFLWMFVSFSSTSKFPREYRSGKENSVVSYVQTSMTKPNWQWAEIFYRPCFAAYINSCLCHVIPPTHPYFVTIVFSVQSGLGNSDRRSIETSWSAWMHLRNGGAFLRKTY